MLYSLYITNKIELPKYHKYDSLSSIPPKTPTSPIINLNINP